MDLKNNLFKVIFLFLLVITNSSYSISIKQKKTIKNINSQTLIALNEIEEENNNFISNKFKLDHFCLNLALSLKGNIGITTYGLTKALELKYKKSKKNISHFLDSNSEDLENNIDEISTNFFTTKEELAHMTFENFPEKNNEVYTNLVKTSEYILKLVRPFNYLEGIHYSLTQIEINIIYNLKGDILPNISGQANYRVKYVFKLPKLSNFLNLTRLDQNSPQYFAQKFLNSINYKIPKNNSYQKYHVKNIKIGFAYNQSIPFIIGSLTRTFTPMLVFSPTIKNQTSLLESSQEKINFKQDENFQFNVAFEEENTENNFIDSNNNFLKKVTFKRLSNSLRKLYFSSHKLTKYIKTKVNNWELKELKLTTIYNQNKNFTLINIQGRPTLEIILKRI